FEARETLPVSCPDGRSPPAAPTPACDRPHIAAAHPAVRSSVNLSAHLVRQIPEVLRRPMIDLHCHMLPGIDDGAPAENTAVAMARIAVADGIRFTACTPHIYPGLYENDTKGISTRVGQLQQLLDEKGIPLELGVGADAHLTPSLLKRLGDGTAPTLRGSRYF